MSIKLIQKHHIYEIGSTPNPSCHASTIVKMSDGRLAAAWFGGTNESDPDVCIWFATKTADGWTVPRRVTPDNGIAHWNPTLFLDPDTSTLWLIYKEGRTPRCWYSMVIRSTDCGDTWTEPERLVPGDDTPRGPVKNKMLRLSDGSWLAPTSEEDEQRRWMLLIDRTADHGKTWEKVGYVPMRLPGDDRIYNEITEMPPKCYGLIQPTFWEDKDLPGSVHLFARSSLGHIYRAESKDYGKTWSCAYSTELPNNNSGIDVTRMDDGTLALIYNPVGGDWAERTPISLSISYDNGATWAERLDLETIPGEYSYPAIIAEGNHLYMTYTYQRKTVEFAEIELDR